MENLEPIEITPTKSEINSEMDVVDEIAKEYAEKVRDYLRQLKDKKENAHFDDINIDELTHDDLIIADKFRRGILSNVEFQEYCKGLKPYFDLKRKEEKDFKIFKDSRANLEGWIGNQLAIPTIISEKIKKRRRRIVA